MERERCQPAYILELPLKKKKKDKKIGNVALYLRSFSNLFIF